MKHAIIVGNGDPPSPELFAEVMRERSTLVCADGGLNTVLDLEIKPDIIVGDLDSVDTNLLDGIADNKIEHIDADNTGTDLQKALNHALHLGMDSVTLMGVTGRRSDHLLWNLSLLRTYRSRIALRIVDEHGEIRLINNRICLLAPLGQKISLSPLDGHVSGIYTKGLRFPLCNETLESGVRDGISNEVVENSVEILVGQGDLLIFVQREGVLTNVQWEPESF